MNLTGKKVWDLSLDEIEYIYRYRHMNHYVYAALKTYHTSSPPFNRPISLRSNTIPICLCQPIEKLLEFSPRIGKCDPSSVRANITYCIYLLYSALDQIQLNDIPKTAELLATCAYLSICSEKNDNIPLWNKPVVRPVTEYVKAIMDKLFKPTIDIEQLVLMPMFHGDKKTELPHGDLMNLFNFMPMAIFCIVAFMENGEDPELIERALLHAEQAMRIYEQDNEYSDSINPLGIRNAGQLRYRSTLYLYGGMFFEKQGWHDRAVDWYLKDIDVPQLPKLLNSFLTDMKTTERLISAYPLITDKEAQRKIKDLIHLCFAQIFKNAGKRGHEIIEYFNSNPSIDKRLIFIPFKNKRMLYASEASREVFFISLLYYKFILENDYCNIDYSRFFEF